VNRLPWAAQDSGGDWTFNNIHFLGDVESKGQKFDKPTHFEKQSTLMKARPKLSKLLPGFLTKFPFNEEASLLSAPPPPPTPKKKKKKAC